jgi:hypothetical protein
MVDVTEVHGVVAPPMRGAAAASRGRPWPDLNAETSWRRWVSRHRAAAAMLGGLVGVHIASVLGVWFGGFHLFRLDYNTGNGAVYLPKASPTEQFLVGGISHYADGVFFALIFAVAVSPRIPLPSTVIGNLAKALIFGSVLALLALFVTAPYVFGPLRGVHDPLIAFHTGWKYVVSVLLFHWIYSAQLGLIYNPIDYNPIDGEDTDEPGR